MALVIEIVMKGLAMPVGGSNGVRLFEVVASAVQVVAIGFLAWLSVTTVNHGNRLSAIEANRFTSHDALIAERAVGVQLIEIVTQLGTKADSDDVPPPEVVRWLERLESRIESIDGQLKGHMVQHGGGG